MRRLAAAAAKWWPAASLVLVLAILASAAAGGHVYPWEMGVWAAVTGIYCWLYVSARALADQRRQLMEIQTRTLTSNYQTITLQAEMLKDQGWVG